MSKLFLTPSDLNKLIKFEKKLIIFDASYFLPNTGINAYEKYKNEHIEKAIFFDIDRISDPYNNLPHMFPSKEIFQNHMQKLGLNNNDTICIYDDSPLMSSARCWFLLRYFGHKKLFILSGGLKAWKENGYQLSSSKVIKQKGNFISNEQNTNLVVKLKDMKEISEKKLFNILDARSFERFSGIGKEPRPYLESGHIPNSLNLPASNLLNNGELISNDKFKSIIKKLNIEIKDKVIATCGSGVSACVIALAFYRLGNHDIPIYDGSWSEWASENMKINKN